MTKIPTVWLLTLVAVSPAQAQPTSTAPVPRPGATPPAAKTPVRKTPPRRPVAPHRRRSAPEPAAPRAVAPRPPRPPAAVTPTAPPKAPRAPKRTGLAVQLSLGTSAQLHASVMSSAGYPGVNGRFRLGYRMGAATLGLGLEFIRAASRDASGEERVAHVVLFRPTLDVVLFQPYPISLYLTLGVHGGFLRTAGRGVADDEIPAVGFHSGLGVRYFLHPRFALGMEGGFQGVWLVDDDGDDTVDGTVLFYGALVLLAIL